MYVVKFFLFCGDIVTAFGAMVAITAQVFLITILLLLLEK